MVGISYCRGNFIIIVTLKKKMITMNEFYNSVKVKYYK